LGKPPSVISSSPWIPVGDLGNCGRDFEIDLVLGIGLDFGAGSGLVMIYASKVCCDSVPDNTVTSGM
jgi:hypothetical protein